MVREPATTAGWYNSATWSSSFGEPLYLNDIPQKPMSQCCCDPCDNASSYFSQTYNCTLFGLTAAFSPFNGTHSCTMVGDGCYWLATQYDSIPDISLAISSNAAPSNPNWKVLLNYYGEFVIWRKYISPVTTPPEYSFDDDPPQGIYGYTSCYWWENPSSCPQTITSCTVVKVET